MNREGLWLIIVELFVLLALVALVDQVVMRVGLTFAVAMLLVQRALETTPPEAAPPVDHRSDVSTRQQVDQLLGKVREFYAACHLARSQQITEQSALDKIESIEKELLDTLSRLTKASRAGIRPAGVAAEDA